MATEVKQDWYVLYDGLPDDESSSDYNGVAFPESMLNEAEAAFNKYINEAFADKNRGLFLDKLEGVDPEDTAKLQEDDSLDEIIAGGFKGFKHSNHLEYKSNLDDWDPASLDDSVYDLDAGLEKDEDGWVRRYDDVDSDAK